MFNNNSKYNYKVQTYVSALPDDVWSKVSHTNAKLELNYIIED